MGVAAQEPGRSAAPDPEVSDKARRRRFTAEYKHSIVRRAALCGPGEIGALLRREGLYSSHLGKWRKQFERGGAVALAPKKRGPKAEAVNPLAKRVEQLEREKRVLAERLRKAEIIIDVQKKVSEILGIPLRTPDGERIDS